MKVIEVSIAAVKLQNKKQKTNNPLQKKKLINQRKKVLLIPSDFRQLFANLFLWM